MRALIISDHHHHSHRVSPDKFSRESPVNKSGKKVTLLSVRNLGLGGRRACSLFHNNCRDTDHQSLDTPEAAAELEGGRMSDQMTM